MIGTGQNRSERVKYWEHAPGDLFNLGIWKKVTVRVTGKDYYRGTLTELILLDGRNLNRVLVKDGYAYCFGNTQPHLAIESSARPRRYVVFNLILNFF
jgi:endonuclease YncB( thermonuclease family)